MPEIGETLRETRMRRRIDMTDVETATKIRAKYLRALENEEWNLLPGPTFVKSFLRTYAQYLGLDARLLVEEYKRRFERPAESEGPPFATPLGRDRDRRGMPKPPLVSPRLLMIGGVVAIILVALFLIGKWGPSDGGKPAAAPPTTTTTQHKPAKRRPKPTKP